MTQTKSMNPTTIHTGKVWGMSQSIKKTYTKTYIYVTGNFLNQAFCEMPETLVNLQNAHFSRAFYKMPKNLQTFYKMPEYFNPFSTNCLTHFSHFKKNECKYKTAVLFKKRTLKFDLNMLHCKSFNTFIVLP